MVTAPKPPGFHTTTQDPKRAHFRVPAFQNTTKIPRKDPQEREEREKIVVGEGKKRAWGEHPYLEPTHNNTDSRHTQTADTDTHRADTHSRHTHSRHSFRVAQCCVDRIHSTFAEEVGTHMAKFREEVAKTTKPGPTVGAVPADPTPTQPGQILELVAELDRLRARMAEMDIEREEVRKKRSRSLSAQIWLAMSCCKSGCYQRVGQHQRWCKTPS